MCTKLNYYFISIKKLCYIIHSVYYNKGFTQMENINDFINSTELLEVMEDYQEQLDILIPLEDQENDTMRNVETVNSSTELLSVINQYKLNTNNHEMVTQNLTIKLESGEYKFSNNPNQAFTLRDAKGIIFEATDPNNKPRIERINLHSVVDITFKNIDFGTTNTLMHTNANHIAIKINESSDITIENADIQNMYEGISLIKVDTFSLDHSHIHGIRRDGIISLFGENYTITNNTFENFKPNYSNLPGLALKDVHGVKYTADGKEPTDHSDGMQFTNHAGNLYIAENIIRAGKGITGAETWIQGINIHNEAKYNNPDTQITIMHNDIKSNHPIGIQIQKENDFTVENNTMHGESKIRLRDCSDIPEAYRNNPNDFEIMPNLHQSQIDTLQKAEEVVNNLFPSNQTLDQNHNNDINLA